MNSTVIIVALFLGYALVDQFVKQRNYRKTLDIVYSKCTELAEAAFSFINGEA